MGHRQMEGTEAGSEDRVRTEKKRKDRVGHGIDRNRELGEAETETGSLSTRPEAAETKVPRPRLRVTALKIVSERARVP